MHPSLTDLKSLVLTTVREVADDDVPSLAAAIAYYTVFSLPPLLVLLVGLAGAVLGPERIVEGITAQVGSAVGPDGADAVRTMIQNASMTGTSLGSKVLGLGALLFGATGAFGQLQKALNRAWEVDESTEEGGLVGILVKRVLSFGMVVTVAFFLLVSLVLSAVLSVLGDVATSALGGGAVGFGLRVANVVVGLAMTAGLFAVVFRVLPDVKLAWRDVGVGAAVTAILFTLGKSALAVYLANADPGSAFGAAGALALLLVWIYYSALILLVGAEFTQAWSCWAREHRGADGGGSPVHPVALPRDPAPY